MIAPNHLHIPEFQVVRADIDMAAEAAYEYIYDSSEKLQSWVSRDEVHTLSQCGKAARLLVANLRQLGHPAYVFDGTFKRADHEMEHYYALMRLRGFKRPVVADPQWIQFLLDSGQDISNQPKVLVGTREMVSVVAAEAGVDPNMLPHWDRQLGLEDPSVTYPNPRFVTEACLLNAL